jgi:alkylated DNA repair dioxygenase AlkB
MQIKLDDNAFVEYIPGFINQDKATKLLAQLNKNIDWSPMEMKIYGKTIFTPRLIHWFSPFPYPIAEEDLPSKPVPRYLKPALKNITEYINEKYNCNIIYDSVLLNKYRDGNDYISWHSDKEAKANTLVVMISLGVMRTFALRRKNEEKDGLNYLEFKLESGSIFIMGGDSQNNWKHSLLKNKNVKDERISLVFREYN